jgi:hypothetical protein
MQGLKVNKVSYKDVSTLDLSPTPEGIRCTNKRDPAKSFKLLIDPSSDIVTLKPDRGGASYAFDSKEELIYLIDAGFLQYISSNELGMLLKAISGGGFMGFRNFWFPEEEKIFADLITNEEATLKRNLFSFKMFDGEYELFYYKDQPCLFFRCTKPDTIVDIIKLQERTKKLTDLKHSPPADPNPYIANKDYCVIMWRNVYLFDDNGKPLLDYHKGTSYILQNM